MSDISGQPEALIAIERALVHGASGILFSGPAGSPTYALAQRITSLMEPLEGGERPTRTIDPRMSVTGIEHEIDLAMAGVLYLANVGDFSEAAIRAVHEAIVPALLVASSFMCPCGNTGIVSAAQCRCTFDEIAAYGTRIALIVRALGIQVIAPVHLHPREPGRMPSSAMIRARIAAHRVKRS